jgi:hypothetical protein
VGALSQRSYIDQILPRGKSGSTVLSRRKAKKVTDLSELTNAEAMWAKSYAATLKAVGWSWRYISDTINIQTGLVKAWADDEDFKTMVDKVAGDIVDGASEHLNRHAVEWAEMLAELARTTQDPAIKLRILEAGLDRVGLSKVNKSESKVTKNDRQEVAFSSEFFERMEGLPIETQQRLAEMAAEMEEIMQQGAGTG